MKWAELEFELKEYEVYTKGCKMNGADCVIIPREYAGLPVTAIGEKTFSRCGAEKFTVCVPNTVKKLFGAAGVQGRSVHFICESDSPVIEQLRRIIKEKHEDWENTEISLEINKSRL